MKLIVFLVTLIVNFIGVENRMLPFNYISMSPQPAEEESATAQYIDEQKLYEFPYNKVIGLRDGLEDRNSEEMEQENKPVNRLTKKPCSILVLSNLQNPTMQSLLRKYRYDAKGVLIPGSVKYYIKLPQGIGSAPILVPLSDKAYSPLGGFVRYYKEVPPIPQSW